MDNASLKWSANNGKKCKGLTPDAEGTGWVWVYPLGAYLETMPPVSKDKKKCRIKVVLKDRKGKTIGSEVSDGTFTIPKLCRVGRFPSFFFQLIDNDRYRRGDALTVFGDISDYRKMCSLHNLVGHPLEAGGFDSHQPVPESIGH